MTEEAADDALKPVTARRPLWQSIVRWTAIILVSAVGLLIAVDWFTGIFRTFLNVNGDSFVAMLVSSKMGELDRDVYYGVTTVEADEIDMEAMDAQFAKADAAD